ncbi:MAG: hypothetical protein K1X55_05985 [Chitinophagales bacterium]|nr:hypothetical protein [Chitinophagales bacterium]
MTAIHKIALAAFCIFLIGKVVRCTVKERELQVVYHGAIEFRQSLVELIHDENIDSIPIQLVSEMNDTTRRIVTCLERYGICKNGRLVEAELLSDKFQKSTLECYGELPVLVYIDKDAYFGKVLTCKQGEKQSLNTLSADDLLCETSIAIMDIYSGGWDEIAVISKCYFMNGYTYKLVVFEVD